MKSSKSLYNTYWRRLLVGCFCTQRWLCIRHQRCILPITPQWNGLNAERRRWLSCKNLMFKTTRSSSQRLMVQLTTKSGGNGRRVTLSQLRRGVFCFVLSLQRTLRSDTQMKESWNVLISSRRNSQRCCIFFGTSWGWTTTSTFQVVPQSLGL